MSHAKRAAPHLPRTVFISLLFHTRSRPQTFLVLLPAPARPPVNIFILIILPFRSAFVRARAYVYRLFCIEYVWYLLYVYLSRPNYYIHLA